MKLGNLSAAAVLLLAICYTIAAAAGEREDDSDGLGLREPVPNKACISVRLPWDSNPIYFCTENKNVRRQRKCQPLTRTCRTPTTDTLLVSTPWDCCPFESNPDYCKNVNCPPKPFNRTCEIIPAAISVSDGEESFTGGCCPKYFCERDAKFDECHLKITEPGCNEPPKDMDKCIGFRDPHGCCPKFQCEGEGKPGQCPIELLAMRYNLNQTDDEAEAAVEAENTSQARSGSKSKGSSKGFSEKKSFHVATFTRTFTRHECVGDNNCPGKLKCCSTDVHVYSDGTYLSRNVKPVVGICTDPITDKAMFNLHTNNIRYSYN